jgi:hypothetical protein
MRHSTERSAARHHTIAALGGMGDERRKSGERWGRCFYALRYRIGSEAAGLVSVPTMRTRSRGETPNRKASELNCFCAETFIAWR